MTDAKFAAFLLHNLGTNADTFGAFKRGCTLCAKPLESIKHGVIPSHFRARHGLILVVRAGLAGGCYAAFSLHRHLHKQIGAASGQVPVTAEDTLARCVWRCKPALCDLDGKAVLYGG